MVNGRLMRAHFSVLAVACVIFFSLLSISNAQAVVIAPSNQGIDVGQSVQLHASMTGLTSSWSVIYLWNIPSGLTPGSDCSASPIYPASQTTAPWTYSSSCTVTGATISSQPYVVSVEAEQVSLDYETNQDGTTRIITTVAAAASGTADISVLTPTVTITNPTLAEVYGQSVTFTTTYGPGSGGDTYQWYNTTGGSPMLMAGKTSSSLTITGGITGSFAYEVVITDSNGEKGTSNIGSATVHPAPLTITASSPTMTYGGTAPAVTASYAGFVNGDTSTSLTTLPTCAVTGTVKNAGMYSTTCSGASDSNYAITYTSGTLTVNPAPLTITAGSASMTYGSFVPPITLSYTGFVNGDSASSLTTAPTCTVIGTVKNAGTYQTMCSGAADNNYAITYTSGILTVNPAPTSLSTTSTSTTTTINSNATGITPSKTTVSCLPLAPPNTTTTCTAVVTGTGIPTGTFTFSESGSFGISPTCILVSGMCSVTTNNDASAGSTVTATYSGDRTHAVSYGTTTLTNLVWIVSASPAIVYVNQPITVTSGAIPEITRANTTYSWGVASGSCPGFSNPGNVTSFTYTPAAATSDCILEAKASGVYKVSPSRGVSSCFMRMSGGSYSSFNYSWNCIATTGTLIVNPAPTSSTSTTSTTTINSHSVGTTPSKTSVSCSPVTEDYSATPSNGGSTISAQAGFRTERGSKVASITPSTLTVDLAKTADMLNFGIGPSNSTVTTTGQPIRYYANQTAAANAFIAQLYANAGGTTTGLQPTNTQIDSLKFGIVNSTGGTAYNPQNGQPSSSFKLNNSVSSTTSVPSTTCKAVVMGTGIKALPTGTVTFSASGSSITPICNLVLGTCDVVIYNTSAGVTVTAAYSGDGTYAASYGTTLLATSPTPTSTSTTNTTTSTTSTTSILPIRQAYTLNLTRGWNLFSVPLFNATQLSTTCSAGDLLSPTWQFVNGQYSKASFISGGEGYWLKVAAPCTVTFSGTLLTIDRLPNLNVGWDIVGALGYNTQFSTLLGMCNITRGPFGFDGASNSYYNASSLVTGQGYFIKVSSACSLGNIPPSPP
jgi:hypothetical protein